MIEPETAPEIAPETAPTPKQIDKLIAEYAAAQSNVVAMATASLIPIAEAVELKLKLTAMVEKWGGRFTDKSKRLEGLHNTATTTTGTLVSIDDEAVEKLRCYLLLTEIPGLAQEFFTAHTSYSLVSGPDEKLKTLTIATRLRTKITGMLKDCFKITTKKPSLKVDLPKLKPAA